MLNKFTCFFFFLCSIDPFGSQQQLQQQNGEKKNRFCRHSHSRHCHRCHLLWSHHHHNTLFIKIASKIHQLIDMSYGSSYRHAKLYSHLKWLNGIDEIRYDICGSLSLFLSPSPSLARLSVCCCLCVHFKIVAWIFYICAFQNE